ncbi:MAG: S8 family serine peptidase, partial [Bryobacteraceae bacterium]|nr:S8 family serine peptidase [Bryobacteraceae bacterium]
MKAVLMGGAPDVTFPLGQHYVYAGFADTPDQIPAEVKGRIALASRGSTVDAGAAGTGLFGNKAAEAAAKGAVALLIFNNVDGELEAATTQAATIPVYGVSKANGEYLRDALGFQSLAFDKNNPATWGTISKFPLRINPPSPSTFSAATTGFSSRGPTDNFQYVKPDVTAPGLNIYSATIPVGGVSTGGGTMSDPSRFISVSGTSFSGPHVAGAAALVRHALLQAQGQAPVPALMLRSGAGAGTQQTQNGVVPQSIVRAALTNTATNLREADGETPVSNTDDRTFIHEIGSGLIHVIGAVDARAAMGTNDANGTAGPDDANNADFLPTHSFGRNQVINTGVAAQMKSVTVTLQNISGLSGAGTYSLALLDGGALRGDVTRPITGTTGFSLSLSATSVTLGGATGNQATFNVNITVDGRPTPMGLALAGTDDTGAQATEFLWWIVATRNGNVVRMPFYYRAVKAAPTTTNRQAPFQNAIQDDTTNNPSPDQVNGVDRDGYYKLSWTFPAPPAEQPCSFQIEEATSFATVFQ